MPRNSSMWVDIRIHLVVVVGLLLVIMIYNKYIAFIGLILLISLFVYGRERCNDRQQELEYYYKNVVKNINELSNYAIENLPIAIIIVGSDGRLKWCNEELVRWLGKKPTIGNSIKNFWEKISIESIWGKEGEYVFQEKEKFYRVKHRPIFSAEDVEGLMVFYVTDVTTLEKLKTEKALSKAVFSYIQIDNYDEVLQGLNEAQRTVVLVEINKCLNEWINASGAFVKRISDDLYFAIMDRRALDKTLNDKFDILDKVRAIHAANKFPVTLSMGVAVGDGLTLSQLSENAKAGLDLALGRGGDQVAAQIDGKMQFYGGKSKAVEKHTRVKARVVAHALYEIIENSDMVLIMGHHNEDFDSLGSAIGVAKMARYLQKEVHIILSEMNEGVDKFIELTKDNPDYADLFIVANEVNNIIPMNATLFVVDCHIPNMTAAPALLDRVDNVIVIDHHRRSENFIVSPLLVYIEPSSSSTSELVTELLMYFSDDVDLGKMDATALYAGIVVDTKNFAVQTGVRTFDAAAYLRRSGADPAVVRHLFRMDYESARAKARALGRAEFLKGGLIVTSCPENTPNAQVTAAQIADAMLRIEDVRMSLVLFQMDGGGIGISARSTGEINVQVIMEQFGGGGHQNVAGAQVNDIELEDLKRKVVELSVNYIEESDQNESNFAARS